MAKCSEVLRALLRHGWYADRQSGSHVILKHPEREDFISFPNHGTAEMGKGLLKKILKQAGLKKNIKRSKNRKTKKRK